MKIKLFNTVLCRTPAFSPNDELKEQWPALKHLISEASPVFSEIIENIPAEELNNLNQKTYFSIWKYFNRAKYRATPFGGFAAFTVSPIINNNDTVDLTISCEIIIKEFTDWKEKDKLINDLSSVALQSTHFQTNSTLYAVGEETRYIWFNDDHFEIASVNSFPELNAILTLCRKKTVIQEIEQYMESTFGLAAKQTFTLIKQLLDLQLLITDQFPNITGPDYFERLNITNKNPGSGYTVSERKHISGGFNNSRLRNLPGLLEFLAGHLPEVENNTLSNFKSAYLKKFEQRAIPLTMAMDPETGVGYADLGQSQTDKDLELFLGTPGQGNLKINYTALHKFLLNGVLKRTPIKLEEFKSRMNEQALPLPNTFSVMLRLWNNQPVIENAGGCTANSLLGRFTMASNELEIFCKEITTLEEKANPDVVFFDIAYQVEKQVDNVNRRKQLYQDELPLLTWSCHPSPMHLDDLLVTIRDGEVVLWSKKHKKRAVPRIPSAYNYTRSDLAVYRFLCDLQHPQIKSDLNLRVRHFFPGLTHYPRVIYKDIIISPAMWLVPQEFVKNDKSTNAVAKKESLVVWLNNENINFLFKAGNSDQTLCFDPNLDADMDQFLLFCRQQTAAEFYISEALISSGNDIKDQNGKNYASEYIVSYSHEKQVYPGCETLIFEKERNMIPPGEDWLYFEIYCHPSRSNEILLNKIRRFLKAADKKLHKWFFIRYDDPAPHIRLRLQLKQPAEAYFHINKLRSVLEPDYINGLISDIQIKTYFRETARYGVDRLKFAEEFFAIDSKYILQILRKNKTTDELYAATLTVMQRLVAACFYNLDNQLSFATNMANGFSKEMAMGPENFKKLNIAHQQIKEQLLNYDRAAPRRLTNRLDSLFSAILNKCDSDTEKSKITADLIHMHINRLFFTDQRAHEAILYQHLLKLLKTRRALSDEQEAPQPAH